MLEMAVADPGGGGGGGLPPPPPRVNFRPAQSSNFWEQKINLKKIVLTTPLPPRSDFSPRRDFQIFGRKKKSWAPFPKKSWIRACKMVACFRWVIQTLTCRK